MTTLSTCRKCGLCTDGAQHVFTYVAEDKIDIDLKDPISLVPLFDPVDLSCAHTFSRQTVTSSLKHSRDCPVCRTPASIADIKASSYALVGILGRLCVQCPFDGSHTMARSALEDHLLSCPMAPVLCSNDGCAQHIPRHLSRVHESQGCDFRQQRCPECDLLFRSAHAHSCVAALRAEVDSLRRQLAEMRAQHLQPTAAILGTVPTTDCILPGTPVLFGQWMVALVSDAALIFWPKARADVFLELTLQSNGWVRTRSAAGDKVIWSNGSTGSQAVRCIETALAMPWTGARIEHAAATQLGNWLVTFTPGAGISVRNSSQHLQVVTLAWREEGVCTVVMTPAGQGRDEVELLRSPALAIATLSSMEEVERA